jgi:hypothetical protein
MIGPANMSEQDVKAFWQCDRIPGVMKHHRMSGASAKRSNLRCERIRLDVEYCDGEYVSQINQIMTLP